ncbi:Hypothetical predicted protein [Paramuricea clavata]|uniref:Uncharacterized protein n=1 Tax=Paramuricea clavata TaxID=317549 RepID=A0A7D9HHJ4_PARCT|nr:Hypothetical predicted protein [Paramuricea clavata]
MLQVLVILYLWLGTVKSDDVGQKWDRLLVGFPRLMNMPLSEHALTAENSGWIKDGNCDENNAYVGNRYIKDNDKSTRLIFGNDGIIAGIQATLSSTSTYPDRSSPSPWIRVNENEAIVTAYFRNPHTICTKSGGSSGNAKSTFGHELYIQTKSWLTAGGQKAIRIPRNENELEHSLWVKGKCFPNMGMHYWYNISANLECKDIFPMFLLYDVTSHKLASFGWSVPVPVPSASWERPPQYFLKFFFNHDDDIPTCLKNKVISTQHIYLCDPRKLQCDNKHLH